MQRIAKTSRGSIELDMADEWIFITAYGEDGWETDGWAWNAKYHEQTLGELLASQAGLPSQEAGQLAEQVSHEWAERRGLVEAVREARGGRIVATVLVAMAVLALWGLIAAVAALIWLVTLLL